MSLDIVGGVNHPGDCRFGTVNGIELYQVLLTQSSTAAPVATVLRNDLDGTVVWSYSDVGIYVATLTGVFLAEKTAILISPNTVSFISAARTDADSITLKTYAANVDGPAPANGILTGAYLEIKVFN